MFSKTGHSFWIQRVNCPDAEVGQGKKQHRAGNACNGNAPDVSPPPQPEAEADDERETAVNHRCDRVKAKHEVAQKQPEQWHEQRGSFADKARAAEQRERGNGTEVWRMRNQPRRGGGENDSA
jgi:hypothetical protein